MDDLKSMSSVGETVQIYFNAKMIELLKANTATFEITKRYNFDGIEVPYTDDGTRCEHCGHYLDDPDY